MKIDELMNKIKEARPNLGASSLKSYKSILTSMYRQINPHTDFNAEFFEKKSKEVLEHLANVEPSRRKTRLSALVVACTALNKDCPVAEKYREKMFSDAEKTRANDRLQKKSEKQEENWMDWKDIVAYWEQMKKDVMPLWSKARLSPDEFMKLQDFVILSLYVLIPPRRILDFTNLKVRGADREKDNYIDKQKTLVFHIFKTAKHYGEQRVEMPTSLQTIVKKWQRIQLNSDYMFVDSENKQLSQSQMTMKLNKLFAPTGKKISVNILRHSYISNELKDVPSLVKLEKMAEEQGHSVAEQLLYVKR